MHYQKTCSKLKNSKSKGYALPEDVLHEEKGQKHGDCSEKNTRITQKGSTLAKRVNEKYRNSVRGEAATPIGRELKAKNFGIPLDKRE
ncbi:hypothetical protein [Mesobacillus jeotgali]|uniref:hypothetical protein n=1 Tax=Mesobacillus jeotgali TaxID=129985 RepID=UPI00111646A7|nr:hypothetical protein [Mesobacillus jeotgali]